MIISIKSSGSGSSRGLIHYLAHSKLDREKEGTEKREFFSESEEDLDVKAANLHLSLTGKKPKSEELTHIVVAPSKEEIERIGDDLKTRKNALKEIVRATIERLEKEVKAKKLKWVAVAHFNTDNPHAHLAIQKEFLNEANKPEKLRIERQMLHYNERGENNEKITRKGTLVVAAEKRIEEISRIRQNSQEINETSQPRKITEKTETRSKKVEETSSIEPAKLPNFPERRILAEEMIIASEIARYERNIENLIAHGDKKRFKIKDEQTGIVRRVSLFDIERRIENSSRRKSLAEFPKNIEKREKFAANFREQERLKQESVIRSLETIRRHVLGFENRHLFKAQEKHTRLNNHKLLIEKKYEQLQTAVPLPLFEPDEIEQLQSEATKAQNLEKVLQLETIRRENAAELNRPSRRESDIRTLLAAKILAELKALVTEKRLLDFAKNKDFMKVKIGNSIWSRSRLERREKQTARTSGFWRQVKLKTNAILFPSDKKSQSAEKLHYPSLHEAVTDGLEIIENSRRGELSKLRTFSQTLNQIYDADKSPNKEKLAPAFSSFELAEAEDLALDAGRTSFYENSLKLQETYLHEKYAEKSQPVKVSNDSLAKDKIIGNFILGRAEARIILAQTKAAQAAKNLAYYNQSKIFIKHKIVNPKTGDIKNLSLRETEPRNYYYLLDKLLDRMLESKEQKHERDAVQKAAQKKEFELKGDLTDSQNLLSRLENQKTEMFEKYADGTDFQPIFTPKEIASLDAWKTRTNDKSEADRLEKIITEAERNNSVGKLQDFLENAAQDLEVLYSNLTKNAESEISPENIFTERRQAVENSREASNQNSINQGTDNANLRENEKIEPEKMIAKEKGRIR